MAKGQGKGKTNINYDTSFLLKVLSQIFSNKNEQPSKSSISKTSENIFRYVSLIYIKKREEIK